MSESLARRALLFSTGLILALMVVVASLPDTDLDIRVTPQTLFEGGSVQVICLVGHHPDNRFLTLGLDGFSSSGLTLDGADAPFITIRRFDHVPCNVTVAYCEVLRPPKRTIRRTAPVTVSGCEQ